MERHPLYRNKRFCLYACHVRLHARERYGISDLEYIKRRTESGWLVYGRWTADQLYEKAEMLRNCRGAAFYCDPPALFCVDETIYQAGAEYDAKEQQRRREKICGLVSKEKPEETMQQTETYFVQMTGIDPSVFIREIYNLYLYLWNRLILSDELWKAG